MARERRAVRARLAIDVDAAARARQRVGERRQQRHFDEQRVAVRVVPSGRRRGRLADGEAQDVVAGREGPELPALAEKLDGFASEVRGVVRNACANLRRFGFMPCHAIMVELWGARLQRWAATKLSQVSRRPSILRQAQESKPQDERIWAMTGTACLFDSARGAAVA